ncbi:hypothetical protein [Pleurocapsa sp. FMAR1]|uniref:hypothetical protein n=1 Tax=Pleurocapsa sp. FMAR1 TaxID=3040204 RepID=UPI0029C65FB9|nr:hypothetical protein [Pleurocapsa sp. FMAR1]
MALQVTDNDWILKVDRQIDFNLNGQLLGSFTGKFVATSVTSDVAGDIWNKGGVLRQGINTLAGLALGEPKELLLRDLNLLTFEPLSGLSYELFYFSLNRLEKTNIKIWEYQGMPLYTQDVSSPVATTATTTTPALTSATAATSILAANINRKSFSIKNKGNKPVYIGFSSSFTGSNAYLTLNAGAIYLSDVSYTGEIWGLLVKQNENTDLIVTDFV